MSDWFATHNYQWCKNENDFLYHFQHRSVYKETYGGSGMKRKIRNASFETQDRFGARQPHFENAIRDHVKDVINDMSNNDLFVVWNDYCEENKYYDDMVWEMHFFDEAYADKSPLEIAEYVRGVNFNPRHDYYVDGIGPKSADFVDDLVDTDELVSYIVRTKESFGNAELEEALAGRWC